MKLQKMTNAVADTEGEIFATKPARCATSPIGPSLPVSIPGGKKKLG